MATMLEISKKVESLGSEGYIAQYLLSSCGSAGELMPLIDYLVLTPLDEEWCLQACDPGYPADRGQPQDSYAVAG